MVVYNADTNCFVLAVSNRSVAVDADWGAVLRPQRVASTPSTAIVGGELTKVQVTDYWNIKDTGITLISSAFTYYNNWADADSFGKSTIEGRVPEAGKIYTCTAVNTTSRWSGNELITIGSDLALGHTAGTAFPGDEGFALQQTVDGIQIFPYDAICYHTSELSGRPEGTIAFAYNEHCFKILKDGEWDYYAIYNTEENFKKVPLTNRIYRYGDTLQAMRKVAGQNYYIPVSYVVGSDEFDSIKARVEDIAILPFNGVMPNGVHIQPPQTGIYFSSNTDGAGGYFNIFGDSIYESSHYNATTVIDGESLTVARQDRMFRLRNELYRYDGKKLVKVGGASVGNTYNVTVEKPLADGEYYSDIMAEVQTHNVLSAVMEAEQQSLGLTITFAIASGSWKTYQYVGPNTTNEQFTNPKNWIDLAGMSAGAEAIINVDALCPRTVAGFYTKDTAIDAILSEQAATGIKYAKNGLVITFRSGEYAWECYQFTGEVSDFASKELWKEFGGGGSVKTSDTPEKDGKEALSTGGAYEMQQDSFDHLESDQDAENHIIKAVSKRGNEMGESIKIPKSTGSGTASGSSLNIYLENPAIYAAFGSDIIARAAIKSVTFDGNDEVLGVIRRLEIIDATSGLSLWSENVNQNSSTSATNYTFQFDFTPYFAEAAAKDFTIVASDAEGNIKRRTITVTAVDVTCTSVQTLNYTSSSALEVGGSTKNLLMYKFANNVSKQGVKVFTEMFYNGEWRSLGVATITDSYSHSISIDPCNVFGGGEHLEHGSYPVRVYGEDVASGVTGNTIYSSIMCVDSSSKEPIVSLRFNDANNGVVRLYDNLEVEVAAYTPGKNSTTAEVYVDGKEITSVDCQISQTYPVRKQIQGYATDGSATIEVYAKNGNSQTNPISVRVVGSAINAIIKEGALFGFDFSTRSNSEPDHSISNNGYTMSVIGSNWSSNGFATYLGENCLRIAENVKARIEKYQPFGSAATERTNGMAFQFAFATNNIKDDTAKLMECYDPDSGVGFYVTGNEIVLHCKTGTPNKITRSFKCGEKHTVGIVVEPSTITVRRGTTEYATVKLYVDGEEIGAIGYVANSGAILNTKNISFDGTDGDFYLYYTLAYDSYYEWAQAFQNYLCKLTDTEAMIAEYDKENVLDNQNRPSMSLLKEKGIPYYVVVAPQATFDSFDGDIDTKQNFKCTLFYFHPTMPWRSFKAENVRWRRQGTTSAKRPIKNDRFYLQKEKDWKITALNPDYTNADALKTYELFNIGYVRVIEHSIPVAILTVKVDYSDSSMANDCGVCDMMNATFRALGSNFLTPAQRAFDGTWEKKGVTVTGLEMNHSTANHPVAAFRATSDSLADAWFHARGNWKEDKGEQVALGFKDTPGYNKGCMNYGDFIEFFGKPQYDNAGKYTGQETLDEIMARFKTTEGLDTSKPYILSQYCGRDYRIMRFSGGEWARSTGSMKQVNGKWVITGDVLNPVSGYELITYDAMDWFMGVSSVDDMMAPVKTQSSWVSKLNLGQETYPAWTQYFECMVDDDQLQEDLAMGRKVPYELFNVLQFCDSCDYSKKELAATWKKLWRDNAWKYMSIASLLAYYTFTDYLAAVDQQAKNMQPMFFLEDGCSVENGVYSGYRNMEPTRMYLNKVYDCDTCNGADNDGGRDIDAEVDPNKMTDEATGYTNPYMGYGSVLFNNIDRQQECWNSNDLGVTTISLKSVVNRMRNQTAEIDGKTMAPFSPDGAMYFFVERRLLFWPKTIATYDCESKYIDKTHFANMPYFYALHGLGLTSLPRFIEQRWAIRDGYYQTGDFFTNPLSGRVSAISANSKIYITAAATGYFGIGNDASGQLSETVYLEAGQSHAFTDFAHDSGALLYIYNPGRMSRIDLSEMSLAFHFDDLSKLELAEEIILGGNKHTANTSLNGFNPLGSIVLGDMPFLRMLDVSLTTATSIDASGCPRVESIVANDTELTTCNLAQTSPIETLTLPATMTSLELVNLPNLSFPGGLTLASVGNITRLWVEGSKYIDTETLLLDVARAGAIREVRIPDVNVTASVTVLRLLRNSGAIGLDASGSAYEESNQCSGVIGRWILTELIKEEDSDGLAGLNTLNRYFPELEVINSQYSHICFSDFENDTENITNMDDSTGYKFGTPYTVPGHWAKVEELSHAYKATFNSRDGKMHLRQISDSDYGKMSDGSDYDPADLAGEGFDIMKMIHPHWRKGVNDYKTQEKHTFISSCVNEPISTATKVNRKKLSDILVKSLAAIFTDNVVAGGDYEITDNPNMNVYELDVEGMKQVRWPGVNNAMIGAVFVGADGKIIKKFNMSVGAALFDFVNGEYVYTDVPNGAVKIVFTSPVGFDDLEAIAVDSSAVEAIEPDWVYVGGSLDNSAIRELCGVYGMTLDSLMRARSISGAVTKRGGDASTINPDWQYDSDGNLTNATVPSSTMTGSAANLINLCRMRGPGFYSIDYEMRIDIDNLVLGIIGDRDVQAVCGYGCGAGYSTGASGMNAYGNVTRRWNGGNTGNIIFGIQNYVGCNSEWQDNVAVNVSSFVEMRRQKYAEVAAFPIDAKWHIYNPLTKTERVVQGITDTNGMCVARVKHGRYCDMIASRCTTDTSKYNENYSDGHWYTAGRSRVPLRSCSHANAYGGLAYSYAHYAGAHSYSFFGVRLTFRGECVFDDEAA